MRGPLIAPQLERELGIPVLDSVAFTLWGCLDATGADMQPLRKLGRMFGHRTLAAPVVA
jgi:maleate isomerase